MKSILYIRQNRKKPRQLLKDCSNWQTCIRVLWHSPESRRKQQTNGDNAFYGCSGITSITIPESVITIGDTAFGGCSSLIGIIIPEGVTTIERGTFDGCSSLTRTCSHKSIHSKSKID
ncbi:leucine-rich repeat domain-containing protein, partial [bacterium 1XD42-8]